MNDLVSAMVSRNRRRVPLSVARRSVSAQSSRGWASTSRPKATSGSSGSQRCFAAWMASMRSWSGSDRVRRLTPPTSIVCERRSSSSQPRGDPRSPASSSQCSSTWRSPWSSASSNWLPQRVKYASSVGQRHLGDETSRGQVLDCPAKLPSGQQQVEIDEAPQRGVAVGQFRQHGALERQTRDLARVQSVHQAHERREHDEALPSNRLRIGLQPASSSRGTPA